MPKFLRALVLGFGLAQLTLALTYALFNWFAILSGRGEANRLWLMVALLTALFATQVYKDKV